MVIPVEEAVVEEVAVEEVADEEQAALIVNDDSKVDKLDSVAANTVMISASEEQTEYVTTLYDAVISDL